MTSKLKCSLHIPTIKRNYHKLPTRRKSVELHSMEWHSRHILRTNAHEKLHICEMAQTHAPPPASSSIHRRYVRKITSVRQLSPCTACAGAPRIIWCGMPFAFNYLLAHSLTTMNDITPLLCSLHSLALALPIIN